MWKLVLTAPSRVDRIESELVEAGNAVYVPRLEVWTRVGRTRSKRIKRRLQAFPGYLFVGIDAPVGGVVRFGDRMAVVGDEEVQRLRQLEENEWSDDKMPHFHPGEEVEVASGALFSRRGTVISGGNSYYLVEFEGKMRVRISGLILGRPGSI